VNIEQTKEAIRVMQAFVDGKELISMRTPAVTADDPYWNWGNDTKMYHIKPTATLRPWTADEVPLGAQVRKQSDPTSRWLIGNTGSHNDRLKYVETHEHSIDGGKTWHPCGVMEDKP
jgi:hypothetical protein